jgi:hypothetical protein
LLYILNPSPTQPLTPALPPPPVGRYSIKCQDNSRAADCALLDTNKDGSLSMMDDMFMPYYPGDDVVDWVGMSIFHFGQGSSMGPNQLARPLKFAQKVRCWGAAGSLLGRCWVTAGSLLGHCWVTVGSLLGHCWVTAGSLLGRCWVSAAKAAKGAVMRHPCHLWG